MKIKKWIGRTTNVIIISFLLLVAFSIIYSKVSGGTPEIFGYQLKTVLSGSMEPSIKTGSIIAINPDVDSENVKVGDVITFKSIDDPNILITHRVVEVQKVNSGMQFVTKGDNNDAADPKPVPAGNVVGEYGGFTIPYAGHVATFVKSRAGALALLIIPGAILIGYALFSIWREISRLEDKKA